MPIYEYRCNNCGAEFELLLFSNDIPECPRCSSKDLTKKISMFATTNKDGEINSSNSSGSKCGSCSGGSCETF